MKVQHPGIREAFEHDMENVGSIGKVATAFFMPRGQSGDFIGRIQSGFLAELDYEREADNMATFAALIEGDPDLEIPAVALDVSSARVLSTTFLDGVTVDHARAFDADVRRNQAAAVRRVVLSALADHGVLYADAHAGNFFFREDGTVGVLDFGSVFRFDDAQREAFGDLRDAALASDRERFVRAVDAALEIGNRRAAEAIAEVQWIAIGGVIRGEAIGSERVREIVDAAGTMKKQLLMERFKLPYFMPFLMRTMVALNALLSALDAPESGALTTLPGARRSVDRASVPSIRISQT